MLKRVTIAAALWVLLVPAGHAQQVSVINDIPILDLLGSVEGPDGYADIYRGSPLAPPRPITGMSVSEVLRFQDRIVALGSESSAVGRYQFIRSTLRELIETHGVDVSQPFDKRMQDYLARMLLIDCGFYRPSQSDIAIGNCLARRWAALPVFTGSGAGRSRYHGVAGNRALVTIRQVRDVIAERLREPEIPVRIAHAVEWPDDGRMADRIPLSR